MQYPNIKIEYQDTPEKFYQVADEIISFLVENLLKLNTIEEEYCALNEKFKNYQKRGIRVKGIPKNKDEIWSQYKTRYGEVATTFCAKQLLERGYANRMHLYSVGNVLKSDGTVVEEKILWTICIFDIWL
ncbi:MAG: hypothetical protein K2P17_02510 [Helicobacteraceae bacterium]|nr:hypothetical protein [Helicobacteraceae bacterium]